MKPAHRKRRPSLWWDFAYEFASQFIVVETNDPKYPIIAKWRVPTPAHSDRLIDRATQLIEDINAGRKTLKEVAAEHYSKQPPGYAERLKIARRALTEATRRTRSRKHKEHRHDQHQ